MLVDQFVPTSLPPYPSIWFSLPKSLFPSLSFFLSLSKDMLIDFRERGREGERGRKTLIGCLSYTP